MSIETTGSSTDFTAPNPADTPRPRFSEALRASATKVREVAPAQARRAGGAVRRNPKPATGVLAVAGGVIAALLLRRRAAKAKAARNRWVPARFRR
ncbi:hypothetical protein [Actinoplanes solisilvae]|uniref:hypothetical protein n=1 Tax=Actinoplanes solisilvae TaxID=2486853 RepID=UPI000FD7C4DB|nr:hypothetical protein [Actinoplanes solisilvae]